MPKVSVLMSVYNGEPYLRKAISSILNQTFPDFEFVIVDDGSTDGSSGILEQYARQDKRIRLVRNARNLGLTPSLNKGLQIACGEHLARQDADDISLRERLALQVHFLEEHPDVGAVGTWINYIDERGRQIGVWRTPTSPTLVRWSLLFGTSLAGASVTMRRTLVKGGVAYRCEMMHAEDYDLWVRLSAVTQLANLPEILYSRRVHNQMICVQHREQQEQNVKAVMQQTVTRLLGEEVPEVIIAKLRSITLGEFLERPAELRVLADLIMRLYKAFVAQNTLGAGEHKQVMEDTACRLAQVAVRHVERWPIKASPIMLQALRLNRHVLSKRYLKGLAHGVLNAVARRKW